MSSSKGNTNLTQCKDHHHHIWQIYWLFPHLMAELVAGHSQDNEPLPGVAVVELVHLGVIPGGRTSERRHILDEDNFPLQGREIKRFSC